MSAIYYTVKSSYNHNALNMCDELGCLYCRHISLVPSWHIGGGGGGSEILSKKTLIWGHITFYVWKIDGQSLGMKAKLIHCTNTL